MTDNEIVGVPIIGLTSKLKAAIAAEAAERGISLNDFCVGVIADRLGVPFEPGGGPVREVGGSGTLGLRMTVGLRRALNVRSAMDDTTASGLVRGWLADEVDLVAAA